MIHVTCRFHDDLAFFLRGGTRNEFEASFHVTRSVKDLIESFGVPHVEVGGILVNSTVAGFDYLLTDGDTIGVFPAIPVPGEPAVLVRFVADVHVKTLARYLRMLGFDTLYNRHWVDEELAQLSEKEERILLSRDTRLLMRKNVSRGMYIRSIHPRKQVIEVLRRYDLSNRIDPFVRCISCNGEIHKVEEAHIEHGSIPQRVLERTDMFFRCGTCGKYYWNGSHVEKMLNRIEDIRRELE